VLTPHGYLRDQLTAAGLRVDRTIPNFIDLERYPFRRRTTLRPRFLYLRGMRPPLYNPALTLAAFRLIQARRPEASLTMGGDDGESAAACRRLAEGMGLCNVRFIGVVPKSDISRIADEHDVYIQSNRIDNMPVTIIEMWASGLPVVATSVGGIPYLVNDGQDGILVPSDDAQALAEACLELLCDPARAGRLSENGRRRAERLTWPEVAPAWREVLGLPATAPSVERRAQDAV
jgi:L-malate glycosyltransferase